ncbi:hypothetical protein BpHYR1_038529 [Brachionus plicatilis]|uniref:Uncharacterized protein n=1 Tax=Brachionus plicatilis TaxID=10195 RepID=A0A3M7QSC8_BRAPC|nr:hypothetical protein BpHYR1_038529 [Brachionus plicatilis]
MTKKRKFRFLGTFSKQNIKLLSSYHDWYCDGTFGTTLPMYIDLIKMNVYALEFERVNASLAENILSNFKPEDKYHTEKIEYQSLKLNFKGDLIIFRTPDPLKKRYL